MSNQTYPTFFEPDRETLKSRNAMFLRALIAAHPVEANDLVRRHDQRAEAERQESLKAIESQVERLITKVVNLRDEVTRPEIKVIGPARRIIDEVAAKHEFSSAAIVGRSRKKAIVAARNEAAWRIVNELGYSLPQTGKLLDRDHSTVIHACRRHEESLDAGLS